MSNGSLTELTATCNLDNDLNSRISLFNYNYNNKKYSKYSKMDYIFYPTGNANWENTIRFTLTNKGDLLYGLYLVVKLPKLSIENLNINPKPNEYNTDSNYRVKYTDYIGGAIINKISLYINGQLIDEQYGDYIQLYIDLYMSDINRKIMLGLDSILNKPNLKIESEYIYIPLKFWFCLDNEKPLPIIALQNSEIYIDIKFNRFSDCISILENNQVNNKLYHTNYKHKEVPLEDVHLLANFYFVEANERIKLASQEYIIPIIQSQVRSTLVSSSITSLDLDFNHVVKDIIFFIQPVNNKIYGEYFNFSAKMKYLPLELYNKDINIKLWDFEPSRHLLSRARILFNGTERIQWRDYKYFNFVENHENYKSNLRNLYIYMYSFNINPTKNTNFIGCDFSRIDNAQLQIEIKPNNFILDKLQSISYPSDKYEIKCYATNFNILIIKNGIAALKYN